EKRLFGGAGSGRLPRALGALETLVLRPLGFLVLPLLYLVKPHLIHLGLARLHSDATFCRMRNTRSPLLELRALPT
uniref:Uncharacterized protein n=1 Tax=Chinchilla lanigera TaxID=34839 RepID=A0A8C2W4G6_CHILA